MDEWKVQFLSECVLTEFSSSSADYVEKILELIELYTFYHAVTLFVRTDDAWRTD